jgi:hypothetical protein
MTTVLFSFIPLDPGGELQPAGKEHPAVRLGGKESLVLAANNQGCVVS